ncbi:MAG: aminotransferase class V-fold PLP-dependent enzyme [Theionarchaea archaeon]|nr:aminotransferase class V-fold PLP-dependent enzyme [Theionarchaea archaeon]
MREEIECIREHIPVTKQVAYLNNAAFGPTLTPVVDAMNEFFEVTHKFSPDSPHFWQWVPRQVGKTRSMIASFINAPTEGVCFVPTTTEGLNIVAYGLDYTEKNEVILGDTRFEHTSLIFPWIRLQKQGVTVTYLEADERGLYSVEEVQELLTPKTNLVAFCHAPYNVGTLQKVEEVARLCKDNGTLFLLDSAQCFGCFPLNFKEIGCDFMVFPAAMWMMGPQGIAFLVCSPEATEGMEPLNIGVATAQLIPGGYKLFPLPRRFEGGSLNYPSVYAMQKAVEFANKTGIENIRKRICSLTDRLLKKLSGIEGITVLGQEKAEERSGIVAFDVGTVYPKAVMTMLDSFERVIIAYKFIGDHMMIRSSVHYYNTEEEIDRLCEGLENILKDVHGRESTTYVKQK